MRGDCPISLSLREGGNPYSTGAGVFIPSGTTVVWAQSMMVNLTKKRLSATNMDPRRFIANNKDAKTHEQRLTNALKIPTIGGSQLASAAVFAAIVCRHEKNIPTQ